MHGGPAQLLRSGHRALARIDASGAALSPAQARRVAWARGVIGQAQATDGGLGALWFLPVLRMAVLALTAVAGAVGVITVAREVPHVGRSMAQQVERAGRSGVTIALIGLSAWVGLSLLERFNKGRRR